MARHYYAISSGWDARLLRFANRTSRDKRIEGSGRFLPIKASDPRVRRTLRHSTVLLVVGDEYNSMPVY